MPDHNITVAHEMAAQFLPDQQNATVIYAALMICETITEEARKIRLAIEELERQGWPLGAGLLFNKPRDCQKEPFRAWSRRKLSR
jgi:hypothetical protein